MGYPSASALAAGFANQLGPATSYGTSIALALGLPATPLVLSVAADSRGAVVPTQAPTRAPPRAAAALSAGGIAGVVLAVLAVAAVAAAAGWWRFRKGGAHDDGKRLQLEDDFNHTLNPTFKQSFHDGQNDKSKKKVSDDGL
jgi:uncharacterized protein HemX